MQAVLFDLDGTLIDTAPDLAAALNLTLKREGLTAATPLQVRSWIGDGTQALLARGLRAGGVDEAALSQRAQTAWPGFMYDCVQTAGKRGAPYPGTRRMLERLNGAGIQVGLVTNKESDLAHQLLVRHELSACFDLLVCGDTLPVRKPDPAMLHHALEALQCSAEDALFVGDSAIDVRTARAAGVQVWAVNHGYGGALRGADAPDRFVESFDELGRALTTHQGLRVSIF